MSARNTGLRWSNEVDICVVKYDGKNIIKSNHAAKLSKLGLIPEALEQAKMLAEDDCVLILVGHLLMAVYEEGCIEEAIVIGVCENSSGYRFKD